MTAVKKLAQIRMNHCCIAAIATIRARRNPKFIPMQPKSNATPAIALRYNAKTATTVMTDIAKKTPPSIAENTAQLAQRQATDGLPEIA